MKNLCLSGKACLCLVLSLCFFSTLIAQQSRVEITGIVRNESGTSLQGVTVVLKNAETNFTAATQTDSTGVFNFNSLSAGAEYSLTFTHVGYESQTIKNYALKTVGNFSIAVKLKELNRSLDEIVLIGYGSVKKSDLTGSVATVSEKDFNKGISTNVNQLIQGKAAGVTILQTNAQPGGATKIQIRGVTS
ncbi:MAG: carboxypeptidase regulatory-like domain-containing protein, partial [Chitinophagaceae bacterium]